MRPMCDTNMMSSYRGNKCAHKTYMVMYLVTIMGSLCDTNMMSYIEREQMNPINLSGNVFVYNHKEKSLICRFCLLAS